MGTKMSDKELVAKLTAENRLLKGQNKNLILNHEKEKNTFQNHIFSVENDIVELREENKNLYELVRFLRRQKFAPKSEIISRAQQLLFDEAEFQVEAIEPEEEDNNEEDESKPPKRRKRGKRKPLPDKLLREKVIIDLKPEDKFCPIDGSPLKKIGEEVSERLEIIPAQIKVIETIRLKYACTTCDETIKIAPVVPNAIPKGIATAGLLAFIAISKYIDALPLYRMEGILQRNGVDLTRGTMARWMVKVGELIQPMINLLNDDLLEGNYISADETPVQVLNENGKSATSKSYMWLRARDRSEDSPPIILFDYDPSRSGDVPLRLLEGFSGYLQVDGYAGYNKICSKKEVIRIGCGAHLRRKFIDALSCSKKKKSKASVMINHFKSLYKIENDIKECSISEKYEIRQQKSKPILEQMKKWLDEYAVKVAPKTLLGKAIYYALSEWNNFTRYIDCGELRIDNNFTENKIRPFAIGRKNWLFSSSTKGAESSAAIYSLLETAKANGHEPYSYLKHVLTEIPKAESLEDFEKLLPYNTPIQKI